MIHKSKLLFVNIALLLVAMLMVTAVSLKTAMPTAFAEEATTPLTVQQPQADFLTYLPLVLANYDPTAIVPGPVLSLTPSGPNYATPGSNISYALTLKNFQNRAVTDIVVFNPLPANTTYVSGGAFNAGQNRAEFTLASLAAKSSHTFTFVVKIGDGVGVGTVIENVNVTIETFTIGGNSFGRPAETAVGTTVEAPGTLVAVYKNPSGTPFDVKVDGYKFDNYTNAAPRVSSDDLGTLDMFTMFGPAACQSGTTAATCVLSGPARKWMEGQIGGMNGGHCEGMAVTSLRLFDGLAFDGKNWSQDFQAGATSTIGLDFPQQSIENYVASYFVRQALDEVVTATKKVAPVAAVQQLTADFSLTKPIAYSVGIYRLEGPNNDFKDGHAITAYGVEKVNDNESRILIYDNNYPKQRQYITVNMVDNTWRYVTSATPGQDPTIYAGTATSRNLELTPISARDMPAGQYFTCPFCNPDDTATGLQAAASGQISNTIRFEYAGEGAILVKNDQAKFTGFDDESKTFINEIPGATLNYFKGGLNKDVPPMIEVPFVAAPDTIYSVYISGKTIDSASNGSLTMTGDGYAMGLDGIQLDPNELLELAVSPTGDSIDFKATQTITAPTLYLAYDPIDANNPSVIFEVDGIILDAGESVLLEMNRDLEYVYFDDTGAGGQAFDVTMTMIWPDGDVEVYSQPVDVPAGSTSAFIDFGAWDGLGSPALYIDDVLQNPSVNHRLKLTGSTTIYDPTPQANAPAGVYHVTATFTNVTEITLEDLSFVVVNLTGGNMLLNADGGPAAVEAKISVPASALGGDGILGVNEAFTLTFDVGLATADTASFTVNANGAPVDWAFTDPAPAGDANNASFIFPVNPAGR
ncbi:MAG: DUF11 domain-containing protein [Caldilineaceae bacterium]|nr:DUF11 domain-containing protein [Caldilineaceae bacterium]